MNDIENLHYAVRKACSEGQMYKGRADELERFLSELAQRPDMTKEAISLIRLELEKVHPHGKP